ncbi:hypothetical protein AB4572_22955, partial [Vibrio splendidus]
MKKVLFVKNILPPYRVSLFNDLHENSKNKSFEFEVFLMTEMEKGRYWKVNRDDIKFNYTIDKFGFYRYLFE